MGCSGSKEVTAEDPGDQLVAPSGMSTLVLIYTSLTSCNSTCSWLSYCCVCNLCRTIHEGVISVYQGKTSVLGCGGQSSKHQRT
jgi:hypothetical protein